MVRSGPDGAEPDPSDHLAQAGEQAQSGWEQTISDMRRMAADRADSGYEVLTIAAGDTTPKPPSAGETDEWGLSYIIPSNYADDFTDVYERATFEETGVYQADSTGFAFIVTECLDHDEEIALFIAGTYQLQFAAPLVRTAMDRGRMYTHVKKLDGTNLGTIEHDDPEAFFPHPERIYAYEM
ncbi:DUF7529 family protein [Halapricum hydrolyticum]|uniref:Uncharacterized protein n=1 Tax=Halapricum hydrolyticum TaxID=2979991 RepID=A0AAE3LDY6_9EURY|nr:hypothetical protein [Halapricum hydrolyticum]MCU4716664.1 hypothetical protein [Halapricum hydrolyticum]MCU4725731.1 hypothetical protein [Halapricum hydrolyticum]